MQKNANVRPSVRDEKSPDQFVPLEQHDKRCLDNRFLLSSTRTFLYAGTTKEVGLCFPLAIYRHYRVSIGCVQKPLTEKIIADSSDEVTLEDLEDDIAEIGYPTG